jgi:ATP-dependent DNA helicase MPH1
MQELIAAGTSFSFHDEISRRILPPEVKPVVDRRVVDIPQENSQQDWLPEPKKGRRMKKPPKKFHMPDNVITGFVTAGRMGEEIVPKGRGKKAPAPVYPSEEAFEIPSFESVLLDDFTTQELERRYQTVFDDDDAPMVGALDLSKHPERQRALPHKKRHIGPGRVTRAFVGTMQRMHDMNSDRLDSFKSSLHYSDCESDVGNNFVVPDMEEAPAIEEEIWEEEDPVSPPAKTKAKSAPKPRAKAAPKPKDDPVSKPKTKATPNSREKTVPKTPAPRGRPRKQKPAVETPIRQPGLDSETPQTRTPDWRAPRLAQEGEESSPPPTDPRFHIASQADTIGSDDTMGEDEPQDTQAYLLDSELASFIVEEGEEEVPASSLPSLNLFGVGAGTQAVVKAGRPKKIPRREKIFTSDPTDDDAVVSSDSEDNIPLGKPSAGASKQQAVVLGSASEDEEDEPILPRKRMRRVIEEDSDDE